MALVDGFPARASSSRRSIRFYKTGTTAGTAFDATGNSFLFITGAGVNPYAPLPPVTRPDEKEPADPTEVPPTPWGSGENELSGTPPQWPPTQAYIWSFGIYIKNTGATNDLEFSFDGVNVHGRLAPGAERIYYNRFEAGMALRGVTANTTYIVEAW